MTRKILITGAGGLIGSEAVLYFHRLGDDICGVDNNTRANLFGQNASVKPTIEMLSKLQRYKHRNLDIRSREEIDYLIWETVPDVIIHCAAQPSHDKAAEIPYDDFDINAVGTLNLLESFRKHCNKDAVFVQMSTNKVYGDGPNQLHLVESEFRYDFSDEQFLNGINETFPIDRCMHSLFGASKLAGDIMAQEYGRYFSRNIGVFRGGCLTGPRHAGAEQHGFLSYIVKCAVNHMPYTIFGYKGKQVRDQIHCHDVLTALDAFINDPGHGNVYNIGGELQNSASILQVIELLKEFGFKLDYTISSNARAGDHICYYSDMTRFRERYPKWKPLYSLGDIVDEIVETEQKKT